MIHVRKSRRDSPPRTVICEVDEIVPLGALDPREVVTPGVYVDYLVQCAAVPIPWRGF